MKKILVLAIVAVLVFAQVGSCDSLIVQKARTEASDLLRSAKNASNSYSTQMSTIRSKLISIKDTYNSAFVAGDKTNIDTVNVDLQTASAEADDVATSITTNFPNL